VHDGETAVGSIVEPGQVQHPVKGVQEQFTFHRHALGACPAPRLRDADDDLAARGSSAGVSFEREGEDVGRPGDVHEPLVEFRHPPVPNEREREVAQGGTQDRVRGPKSPAEERNVAGPRGCGHGQVEPRFCHPVRGE
jgi:hypothetical protein